MADSPAWLLADARVVLERRGAVQAALALEAAMRSDRRNGRAPGRDLAILATVLGAAVPSLAAILPEVQRCWSAAHAEAGLQPEPPVSRFWWSVPETARHCGASERGVRWACTVGRLRAHRTPAGRWAIDPVSADDWKRARHDKSTAA